jgi:hypothetical protein
MKNLQKKFKKNKYFGEIKMISSNEVELNFILPALEKFAKNENSEAQHHRENILKKRIIKYLGFEPIFTINY